MIRLPKSVISFGAIALAAGVFTLAVPRAAHAVAAALVQVTNTTANPVPNQDVDAPARHPFASVCLGQTSCSFTTVPEGKELVIQTLAAQFGTGPAALQAAVGLQTTTGGTPVTPASFPLNLVHGAVGLGGSFTQSFTAYADPGTTTQCVAGVSVSNAASLADNTLICTITGYTVSLP